jgi:AcrR family transcriptional regulator/DNA-binding MarR family transcriptional regulator
MDSLYDAHLGTLHEHPERTGLPRARVTEIQRRRMIAAAVEAVQDVGYARMSVSQVIARARVSRRTFYEAFDGREDCFLAAFDCALSQGSLIASEAYERESGWQAGIRAALAGVLSLIDEEPSLAKVCVVDALLAGERVLGRRREVLDDLARAIDEGRAATCSIREPLPLAAECVVGALFTVLHTRLLDPGRGSMTDLLRPLMAMIVLPYMGAGAANRELRRPALEIRRDTALLGPSSSKDALKGLDMRLTYRTVRVLAFIAQEPGASNREIAEGSGVVDPAQISKLLSRLARLGLAENPGEGAEHATVNAWRLTPRGAHLERATRPLG